MLPTMLACQHSIMNYWLTYANISAEAGIPTLFRISLKSSTGTVRVPSISNIMPLIGIRLADSDL